MEGNDYNITWLWHKMLLAGGRGDKMTRSYLPGSQ